MTRRSLISAAASLAIVLWSLSPVLAAEEGKDAAGTHEGKVVSVGEGKLTMTDKDGKNEHTHAVAVDAKISCDGKECKLADLKKGTHVKVTTEKKGEKTMAVKIEGKTSE